MPDLPFTPLDTTLQDVIRTRYLCRISKWLLGTSSEAILTQASNSVWESALSLQFLWEASDIFRQHKEYEDICHDTDLKSPSVLRWILEHISDSKCGHYQCWENVTWDTAVVTRVLDEGAHRYRAEFSKAEHSKIQTLRKSSIQWLCKQFYSWDKDIKYPFGVADVAQIAITLLHFQSQIPSQMNCWVKEIFGANKDIIGDIVRYLLQKKTKRILTIKPPDGEANCITAYWWDDFFATSEVIEALALFCTYCAADAKNKVLYEKELLETHEAILGACTYCEHSQIDGMWGSHIDSIKVVYVYIKLSGLPLALIRPDGERFEPELHTTFKALRWMCDEKQVFSDGSFLHTPFLTVFFALTLTEAHQTWKPAKLRVDCLYDDVVWSSPMRTTPERAMRMAAEITTSQLKERISRLLSLQRTIKRYISSLVITIALTVLLISAGQLLGIMNTSFRITFTTLNECLALAAIIGTIYLAVIGWVWTSKDKGH